METTLFATGRYRILELTYGNGRVSYRIERFYGGTWVNITDRNSLDEARSTVNQMRENTLISSVVVEEL